MEPQPLKVKMLVLFLVIFSIDCLAFERRDYEVVKEFAESWILKYLPPSENFYVGVGASPDPLITYISLKGFCATSIPISVRDERALNKILNNEKLRRKTYSHIDNYIPKESKRRIVFLDYVGKGVTATNFLILISKYWKSKRRKDPYIFRGWTFVGSGPKGIITYPGGEFGKYSWNMKYKKFRKYSKWKIERIDISEPPKPEEIRQEFLFMKKKMEEFIYEDSI